MSNERFETQLYLLVSHFDEVFGPQIIGSFPHNIADNELTSIASILTKLFDLSTVIEDPEWSFLYADTIFASQNLRVSIANDELRAGSTDFLFSIILLPSHPALISAMALNPEPLSTLHSTLVAKQVVHKNFKPETINRELLTIAISSVYGAIQSSIETHLNKIGQNKFDLII